jgi:predicted adenine nucleotide alpha hydrolase (AANH) superfamily ATPase
MVKNYTCKVCGVRCVGIPQDNELYKQELCGGLFCDTKSRPTKIAVDQPSADDMRRDLIKKSNPTAYFEEQKRLATE